MLTAENCETAARWRGEASGAYFFVCTSDIQHEHMSSLPQTNKFNLRRRYESHQIDKDSKVDRAVTKGPNKEILEHNRRREIEVKLAEYE